MSRGRREQWIADSAHDRLTRRGLVTAALGLGVAMSALADEPPAKISQRAAQYQDTPKGLFSCAGCTFFIRPHSCKVVSGDISPSGWCTLFDLPD